LQAAVKTFPADSKRRIAELAGNAVPMELMLVVLRALALCYPAVFRVWEEPCEGHGGRQLPHLRSRPISTPPTGS
jgi:hypothetical protein